MIDKNTVLRAMLLMFVSALFLLGGCKKNQPEGDSTDQPASDANQETQNMSQPQESNIAEIMEQTTCPVKGGSIDKAIYTKYQGKRVYFCCQECMDEFKADPEKYLVTLPQFAIQGSKTKP